MKRSPISPARSFIDLHTALSAFLLLPFIASMQCQVGPKGSIGSVLTFVVEKRHAGAHHKIARRLYRE